jgi:diphthine synthase
MTANTAIRLLIEMEGKKKKQLIGKDTLLCVVGQAGSKEPTVRADTLSTLKIEDFGPPLHTLILPGRLHFMELEALEVLAGLPSALSKKLQKI